MLVLDNPLSDPNSKIIKALFYLDLSLTLIFAIEGLMKIFAFGLLFKGKDSYLRNYWNLLDFTIILLSVSFIVH